MEHTDQPLHLSESLDRLFGDTLRQLRRAAGLTQAELAERASLSLRGLADLERGINHHPRRETLLALARAFGLAEEDRDHFFEAGRRRPADPSVSGSPLAPASAAEPQDPHGDLLRRLTFPTGTVTFLFTDIEGSTRLLQRLGESYSTVLVEHQRLLRQAWAEHGGVEVDTAADGFFVAFPTAPAAVAWSEGLLSPQERLLFRRLSVFVGGCTLEAAEAVCVAPEGAEPLELDLLDGLGTLVDQSLVQQREEEGGDGGEPRFGMLHVIREYGLERLHESGESEALHRTHSAHFLMLAERAEPELRGSGQSAWLERLERDHDNLRAALDWSLEHAAAGARAGPWVVMLEFWLRRGYWHEGREWMARSLGFRETLPPRERALLLKEAGFVSFIYEDYVSATQWYGESLALFREVEDQANTGRILSRLAHCAMAEGKLDHARDLLPQALRLLQEVRDDTTVIEVLAVQGDLAELEGNYGAARTAIEQAYARAQSAHDTWYADIGRAELSFLDLLQGNVAAAQSAQLESLALQEQMKDTSRSGVTLRLLGLAALEQGDVPTALRHLQRSLALFEELAHQGRASMTLVWLGMARFAAGDLLGAQDAYLRSLRYQYGFAAGQRIAACLQCLAGLALVHNLPDLASRLLGAATQFCGELAPPPLPPRLAAQRERVALDARQALGEEAWAESYAAGQALSLEEVIAEALQAATRP